MKNNVFNKTDSLELLPIPAKTKQKLKFSSKPIILEEKDQDDVEKKDVEVRNDPRIIIISDDDEELTFVYNLLQQNQDFNQFSILKCDSIGALDLIKSKNGIKVILFGESITTINQIELIRAVINLIEKEKIPKPLIVCTSMDKANNSDLKNSGVDFVMNRSITKEEISRLFALYKIKLAAKMN